MTYSETLDYLFNSLPMYHRIGQAAYKADITNTVSLMQHLGHPERRFRSIHVAGTNGKGSVSHMLASILMQAGYKVGLYTSPHLVDFRERIRINGAMIPQEEVTRFVELHKDYMQSLQLSFFEMTVGLAFDYFATQQVDVAVVEVGMGGRLDSTNVITPDLSIITNIGFDHTQFLGNTLPLIAGEKAGIIKPGVPVVIGETHPETRPVFEQKAAEMGAPIYFADDRYRIIAQPEPPSLQSSDLRFTVEKLKVESGKLKVEKNPSAAALNVTGDTPAQFTTPLSGSYQLKNLATLFQALELLPTVGYTISPDNIRNGIARVVQDTGLHGRWEKMDEHMLAEAGYTVMEGGPWDGFEHWVEQAITRERQGSIRIENESSAEDIEAALAALHAECGMAGQSFATVGEAICNARAAADPRHDLVLVTGSIFLVADAVEYYSRL